MTRDVKLVTAEPVDQIKLNTWERKHGVSLPEDLQKFYLSTNGLKFTWAMEYSGNEDTNGGEMNVNSLENLTTLINKADKSYNADSTTASNLKGAVGKTKGIRMASGTSKNKNAGSYELEMKPGSKTREPGVLKLSLKEIIETLVK